MPDLYVPPPSLQSNQYSHVPKRRAEMVIGPSIAYIPLGNTDMYTLVESDDVSEIEKRNWRPKLCPHGKNFYVVSCSTTKGKKRMLMLHRCLVLGSRTVDHKNGNTLDNRRHGNLRPANFSQQAGNQGIRKSNTSGYKGVSFYKSKNAWRAQIRHDGKSWHLGYFATPKAAHEAYKLEAVRVFGEFARTS